MSIRIDVLDRDYHRHDVLDPFSVCVTVKDEIAGAYRLIGDLARQSIRPSEVVIVDGGSTDGTPAALLTAAQHYGLAGLRLAIENGASVGAGRNAASRMAEHDLQVSVDAGCSIPDNLLVNLLGPMFDPDPPDIVAGVYHALTRSAWSGYFIPDWRNERYLRAHFLPSCRCMATRRGLVERAGRFPEDLRQVSGEDTLFGMRAREISSRWVINRKADVGWEAPTTLESAQRLARQYAKANGEIGCTLYESAYRRASSDPVMAHALEGYLEGQRLGQDGMR